MAIQVGSVYKDRLLSRLRRIGSSDWAYQTGNLFLVSKADMDLPDDDLKAIVRRCLERLELSFSNSIRYEIHLLETGHDLLDCDCLKAES